MTQTKPSPLTTRLTKAYTRLQEADTNYANCPCHTHSRAIELAQIVYYTLASRHAKFTLPPALANEKRCRLLLAHARQNKRRDPNHPHHTERLQQLSSMWPRYKLAADLWREDNPQQARSTALRPYQRNTPEVRAARQPTIRIPHSLTHRLVEVSRYGELHLARLNKLGLTKDECKCRAVCRCQPAEE